MFILRAMRLLVRALTAESSHRQIAAGIALGLLVGFVPKGNLLALSVLTAVSACRISLPAVFFSAFLFSWIGLLLEPWTEPIGHWVLTQPALYDSFVWLYDQPLVPWTNFNNTLVMGSFLTGLVLCYPAYRITLPLVEKWEPPVTARIRKYGVGKWLFGAEWAERVHSAI
ncbi:MAG: TIGR03546 family protein [Rubinisphaera brasiliensis]|uniref:TIGR03546 family protein n=1 Tax=Rubinisphaera brasiliensis TaxID=119 RepID=UPI00391C4B08